MEVVDSPHRFVLFRLLIAHAWPYKLTTMQMRGCAGLALLLFVSFPVLPAEAQRTEADVYVGQAIVDFDDKRYDSALDPPARAMVFEPDRVQAFCSSVVGCMALPHPARAIPLLERARSRVPTAPGVAFQLSFAYFTQVPFGPAEPLLDEAFRG